MDYCGYCKHINGVCLSIGFCDKNFCEVRTDRIACSSFAHKKAVKVSKPKPALAPVVIVQPQEVKPKQRRRHSLLQRLTPEERIELVKSYYHVPMGELAQRYGVSRMCLLRTLKELGVMTRKRGQVTKAGKDKQMTALKKHFADRRAQ